MSDVLIQVKKGKNVKITSNFEAAAQQRFTVSRQIGLNPNFVVLDVLNGGEGRTYEFYNENTVYRIYCDAYWPHKSQDGWKPSRVSSTTSHDGNVTTIKCEDYWSTDNDWNDLIVVVTLEDDPNFKDENQPQGNPA
ncbi:hypothetical protein SB581_07580 [Acinetobacter baumannii]|nr:hypothetical protein SB581_07580 [Acinetobacter baumannii]